MKALIAPSICILDINVSLEFIKLSRWLVRWIAAFDTPLIDSLPRTNLIEELL